MGTATFPGYVVTQEDIDVYNIAIATGDDPDGEEVEDESEDDTIGSE
jgi:hypothetical protein